MRELDFEFDLVQFWISEVIGMISNGRIPLWIVGTVAGMGVLSILGLFFYGAYAGLGSSL